MNLDFEKWTDDSKVAFFLYLSQEIVLSLSRDKDKIAAQRALDICWNWLEGKEYTSEYFYNLLCNEEFGITLFQEVSEVEKDKIIWNCIIDAVAYTCRKAYETEGARYFPEPIELVDATLFNHFISCFNNCISNPGIHIQEVYSNLSKYRSDNKRANKNEY